MFASNASQQQVSQNAAQVLKAMRDNLAQCMAFSSWLTEQADSDMSALGFAQADIDTLRGAFKDMAALYAICYGGQPPADPYNYTTNATQVIGPQ